MIIYSYKINFFWKTPNDFQLIENQWLASEKFYTFALKMLDILLNHVKFIDWFHFWTATVF